MVERREAEFQSEVIRWATKFGWMHYHNPDSRRSTPGFPDLVLLHPDVGRLLFAEMKTEKGRVRPAQERWLDGLTNAGQQTALWRPSQLHDVIDALRTHKLRSGRSDGRRDALTVPGEWPPITQEDVKR